MGQIQQTFGQNEPDIRQETPHTPLSNKPKLSARCRKKSTPRGRGGGKTPGHCLCGLVLVRRYEKYVYKLLLDISKHIGLVFPQQKGNACAKNKRVERKKRYFFSFQASFFLFLYPRESFFFECQFIFYMLPPFLHE